MTGRFWKWIFLASLVLAATTGSYAQSRAVSKSVTIQIVAFVPPVINLSLDFSKDSTARLIGYLPDEGTQGSDVELSRKDDYGFEIRKGATIDLGNARLFSNLLSSYYVNVHSTNGGSLRNQAAMSSEAIPYQLRFGTSLASAEGGSFKFPTAGKSSLNSPSHRVALEIGEVPLSAAYGSYTDQLMFSVSVN